MSEIVANLHLDLDTPASALAALAARRLGWAPHEVADLAIRRRSLDARKGHSLRFVYTVEVRRCGEPETPPAAREMPRPVPRARVDAVPPPVIVGTGPAGLFAALTLAEHGVPCVVLERGRRLGERHHDVRRLRRHGQLDPESNVCFGEGGAGTFSDGKLHTRKRGAGVRAVLRRFIDHGADPDIAVDAHPHIGSNRLVRIVRRMRDALEARGATLRFGARVERLVVRDGAVRGVRLADGEEIAACAVILATGHAARDVYTRLHDDGVALAPKGFAVGLRIEHPQPLIDRIQYGRAAGHPRLPPAEYRLVRHAGGRGVFSFCMCPGGYVVPAPAEPERLCVNGMSNHKRGTPWANSALVVEVRAEELASLTGAEDPLAGMTLQRRLERDAYRRGGGGFRAPAQRVTDFLADRVGDLPARSSFRPGLTPASLTGLLPPPLEDALRAALKGWGRSMRGFVSREATLVGVESMTSAPVTVLRDSTSAASLSHPGLYPAGEGAGLAGGIASSALDGERVARAILAQIYEVAGHR